MSRTSDLKAWPSARPGSLATYAYAGCWHDSAVKQRQVKPELHCFTCRRRQAALLFSGYQARARWYPLLQGSRFAATAISIDSLFGCLILRAFRSLLRRSRRREHGWLGEGLGSVVVAPFPVTLTMCVTVKANALNEERMSTFVPTPALLWHSHSTWQRLEDSRNALVVSCGDVQLGDSGRSKETLRALHVVGQLLPARRRTFEHCTSCCPSRDATMVVLTKKKKNAKRRLPLYEKDLLSVGPNVGSEMFSQVRSLAADRVSPPVSKRQNNHLAPRSRLSLKKLLRPAWPRSERGHHSAARGLPTMAWISAIFPGGRHYFSPHKMAKKITDYRDTPALKKEKEKKRKHSSSFSTPVQVAMQTIWWGSLWEIRRNQTKLSLPKIVDVADFSYEKKGYCIILSWW